MNTLSITVVFAGFFGMEFVFHSQITFLLYQIKITMKTRMNSILALLLLGLFVLISPACEKENDADPEVPETPEILEDIDGNTYRIVSIGSQVWMAENLRVSRYNDGTSIMSDLTNIQWWQTATGAYAVYSHGELDGLDGAEQVLGAYGALYNAHAAQSGKLCPGGWRVPTHEDWTVLSDYVGDSSLSGSLLKSSRMHPGEHPRWREWSGSATDLSDSFEFAALPGGRRDDHGQFEAAGEYGYWWKQSGLEGFNAWYVAIAYDRDSFIHVSSTSMQTGLSVRCIKE